MLTPCVSCSKLFYTEESPLWFHCDPCLKAYRKECELKQRRIMKELYELEHCDSCGYQYQKSSLYLSSDGGTYCKSCLISFRELDEYEEAE